MPLHIYMPTYFSCYAQLYEIIRVSTIVCSHITGNCVNTAPRIMLCLPPLIYLVSAMYFSSHNKDTGGICMEQYVLVSGAFFLQRSCTS